MKKLDLIDHHYPFIKNFQKPLSLYNNNLSMYLVFVFLWKMKFKNINDYWSFSLKIIILKRRRNFYNNKIVIQYMIQYKQKDQNNKEKDAAEIQKTLKRFKSIFNDKEEWPLHSGKWTRLSLPVVLQNSQNIFAKKIELQNSDTNKEPHLIKHLIGPRMINLKSISFKNNHIRSIEGLAQCDFQNVEEISLSDNFITNIKQLRKFRAPNLKNLVLFANKIISGDKFFQSNFGNVEYLMLGINCIASWQFLNKLYLKYLEKTEQKDQNLNDEFNYNGKQQISQKQTKKSLTFSTKIKHRLSIIGMENNRQIAKNYNKLKWRFNYSIFYG